MSARYFMDHRPGRSVLHRAPAGMKLALALVLVLAVVSQPRTQLAGLPLFAAILAVLCVLSRIPASFLLKRLLLLEPLVLGVAGLMLLQPGGLGIFAIVMFKANLCLLTTILLAYTTPFTAVVRVLQ